MALGNSEVVDDNYPANGIGSAKKLNIHMEGSLHQVIHSDQTGFMRNRHLFFNIRHLMNILYSPGLGDPEVVVSLNAEKAFDRIEWDYLTAALYRFGFGPKFIAWENSIYFSPMASVRTSNLFSDYFPLHHRSRQGCPLSPLLFALANAYHHPAV